MTLPEDWKEQMRALTPEELRAEIEKEELELGNHYTLLYDLDKRLDELAEEYEAESERDKVKQFLRRERTIERLTRRIEEKDRQIADLSREAQRYERLGVDPYAPLVSKIIYLETAASLWRSVKSLRGWRTQWIRSRASYRGHQKRIAPYTERIREVLQETESTRREARLLADRIKAEEARLAYKRSIIPPTRLNRVTLALYLIVEAGEHEYPREEPYYILHRPHYRKVRHRVKYPKGRFQSLLECDAFTDARTGEIQLGEDPLKTLLPVMREEVADEFIEEFSLKALNPDDLTLGEVSTIPDESALGKPPLKLKISRTDEETGREWGPPINRYIMLEPEYWALIQDMKDYLDALEALG